MINRIDIGPMPHLSNDLHGLIRSEIRPQLVHTHKLTVRSLVIIVIIKTERCVPGWATLG